MIEPSHRDLAETARAALELAVVETTSIRHWADRIIATDGQPPQWAIDVSLECDRQALIDLLAQVPGQADLDIVQKLLFAQICRSVKQRRLAYRETANELLRCYMGISVLDWYDGIELEIPALNYEQFDACRFQSQDNESIERASKAATQSVDELLRKYQPFEVILTEHFG